jgi:CRISPR-associated protein Csb1
LAGSSHEETLKLRRYILGLALVSLTAPMDSNLREGCELVPDPERPATWKIVKHDGTRTDRVVTHEEAVAFATAAAKSFHVAPGKAGSFDSHVANEVLKLSEDDRKKLLRQGPVTKEAVEQLGKKSSKAKSKDKQ